MNPYRDEALPPDSRSARRAARLRLGIAGAALLATGVVLQFLTRSFHPRVPDLEVPPALLVAGSPFPQRTDLRRAAPLEPLLAADAPDGLAVLQPEQSALNLRPGEPLVLRFNRPMVDSGHVGRPLEHGVVDFTPSIRGTLRWTSRSTASFEARADTWSSTRTASLALADDLRSLAGEAVDGFLPRTVVFDAGPRYQRARRGSRLIPGEPIELFFSGKVDPAALPAELMVYEVNGGRRMLPFSAVLRPRDKDGLEPVELRLKSTLEPGARIAVALAPPIAWGGENPRVVDFQIAPRPHIEGIACPETAAAASDCAFSGPPGRIVDIAEELRLLATEELAEVPRDAIEVSPPLPSFAFEVKDKKKLVIHGDWDPEQVYEIRVGELRDSEGRTLSRTPPLAVRSAGRPPEVRARSGRLAFEQDAEATLAFDAIHVEQGEARVGAVPPGQELEAALYPDRFLGPAQKGPWQRLKLSDLVPSARANRWGHGTLPWMDSTADTSVAVLSLIPDTSKLTDESPLPTTFVQRTDLGIEAKLLPRGLLAWVTSISGARPVAGARITVAGPEAVTLAGGTTDARGVVWIPLPKSLLEPAPADPGRPKRPFEAGAAVLASSGSDRAVLVVDARSAMGPQHLDATPGQAPPPAKAWVATVFTDRGICRPGETIHAKAVVRAGDGPAVPSGSVRMMLFAPTGAAAKEERSVPLTSFGTAGADFVLGAGDSPGRYRIEARRDGQDQPVGSVSFRVGDYQPPTFRVDLAADTTELVDRDPVHARVTASYLFGAPAAGLPMHWTLYRTGTGSYPARWDEYTFSPFEDAATPGNTIAEGNLVLDAGGRASVDTIMVAAGSKREDSALEVTVRDVSGAVTSGRRRFSSRPAAFDVGMRSIRAWVEPSADLTVEAIVIHADGTPAPGRKVEARVLREGWHAYWEWSPHARRDPSAEDDDGSYQARRSHTREVAHRCALTSAQEPVRCAWKPERSGTYVLEAVTVDDRGRTSRASQRVYVAGPDEHPDRDAPGTPLSLTPDQESYDVGQTAEVAFESPFSDAEALLTVERDGVLFSETRRVAAGGNVLRFQVTAAMVPNAFVSLGLVKPRTGPPGKKLDLNAPDLRVGLSEIAVRPVAPPLTVGLEASPSAPAGSEVPVTVVVHGASGEGVAAEVALYAVDEGTLRITGYALPDPLSGLFRRLAPAFAWEDLRRGLVSRIDEPPAASAGGDGGEARKDRLLQEERFDPTPLWLPHLMTDASGRASTVLRLPPRATQYRLMAVAMDQGTRAGRAEQTIVASMPVVLRPALPAAVTVGDRFQAAVFVHNTEDAPADVTIMPVIGGQARLPRAIHLAPHAEERVTEAVEVGSDEVLPVRFEARAQGATAVAEARIPVLPRGRSARFEVAGAVVKSRDLTVELPAAAAGAPGVLTLSLAMHPFVGLDTSFEALLASPEAGAEVTASSLIALASYASLDAAKRPGRASDAEVRARVASALARLAALQTWNGGFGDFTSTSTPNAYLSAYVLHALSAARRAGFEVPEGFLERTRKYVREEVRGAGFADDTRDDLAFALRALAEAKERDMDRIKAVFDQRERLTPYGLAQLALAMQAYDRRRDTLVVEASERVLATRGTEKSDPRILRWYDSSARTFGAVLEAALAVEVGRRDAGRLAARVLASRSEGSGSWWSTHETAHALASLASYAATVRSEASFAPRVLLDGAPLEPSERSAMLAWYSLPASRVSGAAHTLRIEADGTAWFWLGTRYVEPLGPLDEVARGEVAALHRVLEDATGKPLGPDAHVKLGDLVRVRLFLYTEREAPPYLALRDRTAGGLEPLDAAHETTPRASLWALLGMGPDDDDVDARGHWAARTLDAVSHRAFTAGRAAFYLAAPAQGLRELTYGARASAVGTFVLPPAEVEALYDSRFVARSAVSTLTVDP